MDEKLFTTAEAGKLLGISPQRVLQLVKDGRLKSVSVGSFKVFKQSDIDAVKIRRNGRPKKVVG